MEPDGLEGVRTTIAPRPVRGLRGFYRSRPPVRPSRKHRADAGDRLPPDAAGLSPIFIPLHSVIDAGPAISGHCGRNQGADLERTRCRILRKNLARSATRPVLGCVLVCDVAKRRNLDRRGPKLRSLPRSMSSRLASTSNTARSGGVMSVNITVSARTVPSPLGCLNALSIRL